jgi:DNA mismatch repair protein MutL
MPIKVLDAKVVAQIAAGEVVERPASVVKELVENSLDAGSSQISIEVRSGGVSLIRVVDNGVGIPSTEVELAFDRYATSKISTLTDLDQIGSLGFRGEALPSIAAVAEVDIATCPAGETAGTYVSLKDGLVVGRGSQGRSPGTTVAVRNLFRRVPARLKFLKSPTTENSHIAHVVSQYALAFPEARFALSIDGKETLRTPGSGRLIDSIIEVYGVAVAQEMLEIGSKGSGWQSGLAASSPEIAGMVGSPKVGRSGRGYLSFFVNRRWVSSRLLARAVEEAYHGLLLPGKHPVAVINITLPSRDIDVNIHPAKTEVKFQNEQLVFGAVQKAVRRTLVEQMPVPQVETTAATYGSPAKQRQVSWALPTRDEVPVNLPSMAPPTLAVSLPVLRVLGQVLGSYIIAEGPDGLYLIDQHAAHERVLFEKVRQERPQQRLEIQGLFDVNPRQDEVLKSHREVLAEFGFSIEPFGDRTYLVRAVPALLHHKDWTTAMRELLDSPPEGDEGGWVETIAMSIACHSAVRAGQPLSDDEMRELVRQLEQVAVAHTCPHGRPTMIHLSSGQWLMYSRRSPYPSCARTSRQRPSFSAG